VNHDELLREVKRLLRPNGLFIVSTPNKSVYRNESPEANPYHVSEMEPMSSNSCCSSISAKPGCWASAPSRFSSIWPMQSRSSGAVEEWTVERGEDEFEFIGTDDRVPLYIVALASDSEETLLPTSSILIDSSNELFKENQQMVRELLRSRESIDAIIQLRNELDWYVSEFEKVRESVSKLMLDNYNSQVRLEQTNVELAAIYSSNSWKLLNRIWQFRDRLLPQGSLRRRWMKKLVSLAGTEEM
jgi:hypothetical protein